MNGRRSPGLYDSGEARAMTHAAIDHLLHHVAATHGLRARVAHYRMIDAGERAAADHINGVPLDG